MGDFIIKNGKSLLLGIVSTVLLTGICCSASASQFERFDLSNRYVYFFADEGRSITVAEQSGNFFTRTFRPALGDESGEMLEEEPDGLVSSDVVDSGEVAGVEQSGKDSRKPVDSKIGTIQKSSKEWPYCVHVRLALQFNHKRCGGTGTLIGPCHILTAGHNVKNKYGQVRSIEVIFGSEGTTKKIGTIASICRVYAHKNWCSNQDPNDDIALLILDRPIGNELGWYGLAALEDKQLDDQSLQVTISGYPRDVGLPGLPTDYPEMESGKVGQFRQMWMSCGALDHFNARRILYKIDTSGGQSGSGIWYGEEGNEHVLAVHTYGETSINSGTRLTADLFHEIISIVNANFSAQPTSVRAGGSDGSLVTGVNASGNAKVIIGGNVVITTYYMDSVPSEREKTTQLAHHPIYINCSGGVFPRSINTQGLFVNRSKEDGQSYLQEIFNNLSLSGATKRCVTLCALDGMGGVGKTTLAVEYAWAYGEHYDAIFWIDASSEASLKRAYVFLLKKLLGGSIRDGEEQQTKEGLTAEIVDTLSVSSYKSCLLICDNVEQSEDIDDLLSLPRGHILCTSRHTDWRNKIDIGVLREEEAIGLLYKVSQINRCEEDMAYAKQLVSDRLGGLALAITQAGSYISQTHVKKKGISIKEYIDLFDNTAKCPSLLNHEIDRILRHQSNNLPLVMTWQITMEKISDKARRLMAYFAYLAPDNIPVSLFCGDKKEEVEDALNELILYSMIKRDGDYISIHRLMQLVKRLELEQQSSQDGKMVLSEELLEEMLSIWCSSWLKELGDERDKSEHTREAFLKLYDQATTLLPHVLEIESYLSKSLLMRNRDKLEMIHLFYAYLENTQRMILTESMDIVLDPLTPLIQKSDRKLSDEEFYEFLKKDFKIDSETLANLISHAEEILRSPQRWKIKTQKQKRDLLRIVHGIDSHHLSKIIPIVRDFIKDDMGSEDQINVLSSVAKIDSKNLDSVVLAIRPFLEKEMDSENQAQVICSIASIDPVRFHSVIRTIKHFIKSDMSSKDKADIISAIAKIEPSHFDETIQVINSLVNGKDNKDRVKIIYGMAVVEPVNFDFFSCAIPIFLQEEIEDWENKAFIQAFSKIESCDKNIVLSIIPFLKRVTNTDIRIKFLKVVNKGRVDAFQDIMFFIQSVMDNDPVIGGRLNSEHRDLIEAVANVDARYMKEMIRNINSLLKSEKDKKRLSVIKEITKYLNGLKSCKKNISFEDLDDLKEEGFNEKVKLSRSELDDINKVIVPLLTDDMDRQMRAKIIEEISKINYKQRGEAVRRILSFRKALESNPSHLSVMYRKSDLHILVSAVARLLSSETNPSPHQSRMVDDVQRETPHLKDSCVSEKQDQFSYNFGDVCFNIAQTYRTYNDPNESEAAKWYEKAAEQGNEEALCELALIYEEGATELPKNYEKAFHFCRLSAERSNARGQRHLGRLYALGRGEVQDISKAEQLLRQCHQPSGLYNLGALYDSIGNFEKSAECYREGVTAIEEAKPSLRLINMRGFPLGDEEIKRLLPFIHQNVIALYFDENKLSDVGISIVCENLPHKLDTLSIAGNQIGNQGMKILWVKSHKGT